jgi:hypothetical protein
MALTIRRKLWPSALLVLCAVSAGGQTPARQPHEFLRKYFGFSTGDIAALDTGRIVIKLRKPTDKREIAALGVMRLNVSKQVFLQKFMDIESFKKSEFALQVRKFSSPPRAEDLSELSLEPEHLTGLKKCKVGDCNVKMPAAWIERFLKIDWSAPDNKKNATELTRQLLFDYVQRYLNEGNSSLVEYSDRPYAERLGDEVGSLLSQSTYLTETAPDFQKYLAEFPRMQLPGVETFIYWSKEKVGHFKPVLSLTHVAVFVGRNGAPLQTIIASKQIYASHYFEGSLALTWLVDAEDTTPDNPACYLIYFNRSRMDALRGGLNWLKRYLAGGRIREGLLKNLQLTKERVELPAEQP